MNKNTNKSKNAGYYQKIYDEYNSYGSKNTSNTHEREYKYDIKLDEYFRIRSEEENETKTKDDYDFYTDRESEEKNKKMTSGYLYGKNRTLLFQTAGFFLTVAVIVSGIFLYAKINKTDNNLYDYLADFKQDANVLESIQAAVYDEARIKELNAAVYSQGIFPTATAASGENQKRIFKKYSMKYIDQNKDGMPNGCEVVSLAMVLSRYLPVITPQEIADKYLPKKPMPVYYEGVLLAENPTDYYIGDPAGKGYGIFAPGLTKTAQVTIDAYKLNLIAVDISGCSEDELFKNISDGNPVIVWITMGLAPVNWGLGEMKWHLPDWKLYKWPSPMHCAVLVDYTNTKVTLYDPTAGVVDYDRKLFIQRWNELGPYENQTRQAVVIK